jgi:adenine phosphoribosyltransferase
VAGNRRIDVSGTVFSVAGASISRLVRTQADFPQPGVLFRDLTPVLADAEALREVGTALAAAAPDATLIAGLESRGFLLGAAAAIAGTGVLAVRKLGGRSALPGIRVTALCHW